MTQPNPASYFRSIWFHHPVIVAIVVIVTVIRAFVTAIVAIVVTVILDIVVTVIVAFVVHVDDITFPLIAMHCHYHWKHSSDNSVAINWGERS